MTNTNFEALINLLDDPDKDIYKQIKAEILTKGVDIIPTLESAWEDNSLDSIRQKRIEEIVHEIQFNAIISSVNTWKALGANNLIQGAIIIAKYQYPDIDEKQIYETIDQIKRDVWLEVNEGLTAIEKIKVINHILFNVHNFRGNTNNYHAPQNSYINNVLDTKKGNPLLLSIIYADIAQGINLPIYGINLPQHFVLGFKDDDFADKVLFYVNPFSKGSIFNRKEIDHFLEKIKVTPKDQFYQPCSNQDIIGRLVRNLIFSYEKLGYPTKVAELRKLQKILSSKNY